MLGRSQIQPVYRQQTSQQSSGGQLGKVLGAAGAVAGGIIGAVGGGGPGGAIAGASAGASLGGMAGGLIDPQRMTGGGLSAPQVAGPLQPPKFSENGQILADAMRSLDQLPTEYRTEFQDTLANALLKDLAQQGQGRMA